MFMIQLQRSIDVSIKLSMLVRVENVGAILMAGNITATSCLKHFSILYEYAHEYEEDRTV